MGVLIRNENESGVYSYIVAIIEYTRAENVPIMLCFLCGVFTSNMIALVELLSRKSTGRFKSHE